MDVQEQLEQVKKVSMLLDLPDGIRDTVCQTLVDISETVSLFPGEVLYVQGTSDENTGAILLSGSLEIESEKGKHITVKAPDLVGEMLQVNPDAQRRATVKASEESVALVFRWHDLVTAALELFDTDQQMALKEVLTKYAGKRLKELYALEG